MDKNSVQQLTDEQVLRDLQVAAAHEHQATARLVELLSEVDARRLYLPQGYSSLFVYCTRRLGFSEHAAYGRIEGARIARKFPILLEWLRDGSLTLTNVCLLAGHLTHANHRELLEAARRRSKREVEQQIAALRPLPALPPTIRKLPQPHQRTQPIVAPTLSHAVARCPDQSQANTTPIAPEPRSAPAVVAPLSPERYKLQMTISRETHDKLYRAQALLRHVVPNGDLAVIFDRAMTLLVQDLEARKLGRVDRPRGQQAGRSRGRHVPAAVKREVWRRDGGQCAFVGTDGRCGEQNFLEFHHVVPFADGGPTSAANLQLRCRAHNQYEAAMDFGLFLVREHRRAYSSVRTELAG